MQALSIAQVQGHHTISAILKSAFRPVGALDDITDDGHASSGISVGAAAGNGVPQLQDARVFGTTQQLCFSVQGGCTGHPLPQQQHLTSLFAASRDGQVSAIRALIKGSAVVDKARGDGSTPFSIACQNGHAEAVKVLVEAGARVNRATKGGPTPLFVACQNGHVDTVKILVGAGAAVNRQTKDAAATPLFVASQNGHAEVVAVLLASGATVNRLMKNGSTPLFAASIAGHTDVVHALVMAGADTTKRVTGQTALSIARSKGHDAIAAIIRLASTVTTGRGRRDGPNTNTVPDPRIVVGTPLHAGQRRPQQVVGVTDGDEQSASSTVRKPQGQNTTSSM